MAIAVLGLASSARRRGNTAALLDRALEGAAAAGADTSRVDLCRLRIAPCLACDGCYQDGICVVRDDFQAVLDQLLSADAVILASPLYFMGVTGWAKAFIDRGQCLYARKYILHQPLPPARDGRPRRGIFLSTGGQPRADFSGAVLTVKTWFKTMDTIYLGDVLRRNVDEAGKILEDPTALAEAYRLGWALVRLPEWQPEWSSCSGG